MLRWRWVADLLPDSNHLCRQSRLPLLWPAAAFDTKTLKNSERCASSRACGVNASSFFLASLSFFLFFIFRTRRQKKLHLSTLRESGLFLFLSRVSMSSSAATSSGGGGGGAPGATASSSKTRVPGRPLQVVRVCSDAEGESLPIELNEEALDELHGQLKLVRQQHGELPLVVHSAAGTFREGKSFILDCFLRYLYHLECTDEDDLVLEHAVDTSFMDDCNLTESLPDGSAIFETRSSTDRVTQGIWFYSRPFVIRTASDQKVAVLLMDTQGLFDTAASSALDAPIFALSLLLSSKQIINKRGQFTTNDWQLLNLFTEFANEIVRRLHRGQDPELLGEKAFQELEFLSRDFQNFQMRFDDVGTEDEHGLKITTERFLAHCTEASNEYLDKMTAQMMKHHTAISERIHGLYQKISCTCLTHPGEKMTHPRWKGDSAALSDTFRALVANYCRTSFANPAFKCVVASSRPAAL